MNAEVMQTPQLSMSRLLLLGASSVILCISFIMTVFSPFPLSLAIILYGRAKGYALGLVGLAITFVIALNFYGDLTLFGVYFGVLLLAVGISEVVLRGIAPVKGLVGFGLGFLILLGSTFAFTLSKLNTTPKNFIIQQIEKSSDIIAKQKAAIELNGDKDSIQVLELLDKPELMANELIESFPSYLFIGVFIMLWFNMFLVLKSRRLLLSGHDYPYSERNLLKFQVPFGFVLVLVAGLVLAVWGNEFGPGPYELVGFTIIKCLGIFYFFQGFGVFSDLLNFLGIVGFFRTLIVIMTIFMGNYLIAIAGLFDNWFDFRKYFVKRKTED